MLSQEARNEVPAVSLALGTSPPPLMTTADTRRVSLLSWVRRHDIDYAAFDGASDGPPHTPGRHTA
jgi:hypothetical protein